MHRTIVMAATLLAACGMARTSDSSEPAGRTAEAPIAPRAIREVRPVPLPGYDGYPRLKYYAPDAAEYEQARSDRAFVLERLTYRSDDLDVFAYLYRPASPPKDRRLPVVVFNRGSYVRDEFAPEILMPAYRLARAGFVVVAPMLRGSGGAPGHDEMGGADLNDIFNVVPVVAELPYADQARLFLYGESRGGIMSLLAAKRSFPARAIAVWGAITDLGTFLAGDSPARGLAATIWPGFPANEAEIVESRSAIRWPERIHTPVLLMNGGADPQVSPLHALELATALQKLGRPYELKIFQGENHIITARSTERDQDAIRWFRRFDTDAAPPKAAPAP
jgi:dipeptidyl aminopeptidase/acylaminoacyl peptidase